jgi:hypothetical protein
MKGRASSIVLKDQPNTAADIKAAVLLLRLLAAIAKNEHVETVVAH